MGDTVRLNVSLLNTRDTTVYVDRRMFWGGLAGGLRLEIADEQGKAVPLHAHPDALMPPPSGTDLSILVRLDSGFFYGTSIDLPVKEIFPRSGSYSLRVIYNSMLRRDMVAPQLRDLPVLWADSPMIPSQQLRIQIK